jgi:hypothetical protein
MTDAEKKALKAAHNKKYRNANKERIAANQKKYREANKELVRKRKRAYREANKERIAAKKAADLKTERGRELDKIRGERYRTAHAERVRELHQKSRDKRAPIAKEEAKQKRVELQNSYVAQMLRMPTDVVPPELLEAERIRLKIKRKVQELDNDRTEKKCSTCREYKPLISFGRSWGNKDGHSYECRLCSRARKRRDAISKGLTYTPRKFDDFGRRVKHTPEELNAAKNAHAREVYARNKQRKNHETHK